MNNPNDSNPNRPLTRASISDEQRQAPEHSRTPAHENTVPGPFIFIATNELQSGAFRVERQRVADLSTLVQAREPRLIAFNEYAHDDGSTVSVVQIHPDSDSMEFHMELVREQAARAHTETAEATTGIQVFGTPSSTVLEVLNQQAGSGVPTSIVPLHVAGFTRTGSKTHT